MAGPGRRGRVLQDPKACTACGRLLPREQFHRNGRWVTGRCRDCTNRRKREQYARDPGPQRQAVARYRARNPQKVRDDARRWRAAHVERVQEYRRRARARALALNAERKSAEEGGTDA